jgi:hypothetical protein
MSSEAPIAGGMSPATASRVEHAIIGLGLVALALIFQPFSLALFGIGCVLVVIAGLANNLLPLCEPGRPFGSIVRMGLLIIAIFFAVALLAIGSAHLYGLYLTAQQG